MQAREICVYKMATWYPATLMFLIVGHTSKHIIANDYKVFKNYLWPMYVCIFTPQKGTVEDGRKDGKVEVVFKDKSIDLSQRQLFVSKILKCGDVYNVTLIMNCSYIRDYNGLNPLSNRYIGYSLVH